MCHLICCVFSPFCFKDSKGSCDYYAATGSNFTVLLDHVLKDSQKLTWKHESNIIFRGSAPVARENIYQNGSLKLTKLNENYTGTYAPEVHSKDGISVKSFKSTTLCVLGR